VRTRLDEAVGLLAALAIGLAAGCGYHFVAADTSALPPSASTIYVAHFENQTRINGINDQLELDVKKEISDHKRLVLVDNPTTADLTLSGDVTLDNPVPTTFNSVAEPTQYTETFAVDAVLRDNKANKVLWSTNHLTDVTKYSTVAQAVIPTSPSFLQGNLRGRDISQMTDIQVAQSQQDRSETQMTRRVAKSIYASMVQGF
jgi:outer membrane lipopolysaccharide assembly protein LptE/RlpB